MCIYDILWLPSLLDTVFNQDENWFNSSKSILETKHICICSSIYVSIMQTNCVNGSSSSRKHSTHCFQWVVNSCLSFTSAWAAASAMRRNSHSVLELSLVIKHESDTGHQSFLWSLMHFSSWHLSTPTHKRSLLLTVIRCWHVLCEWQLKCFCFVLPPKHNFQAT